MIVKGKIFYLFIQSLYQREMKNNLDKVNVLLVKAQAEQDILKDRIQRMESSLQHLSESESELERKYLHQKSRLQRSVGFFFVSCLWLLISNLVCLFVVVFFPLTIKVCSCLFFILLDFFSYESKYFTFCWDQWLKENFIHELFFLFCSWLAIISCKQS